MSGSAFAGGRFHARTYKLWRARHFTRHPLALADAPGFAAWTSLLALGAFTVGALIGGRMTVHATLARLVTLAGALVVALTCATPYGTARPSR